MKRTDSSSEIIRDEERIDDGLIYRYRLIRTRSLKVASYQMPLYSIEVQLTKDGAISENSLCEVFSDLGKALVFFDKLVDNLATPIDLPYILEDKISL